MAMGTFIIVCYCDSLSHIDTCILLPAQWCCSLKTVRVALRCHLEPESVDVTGVLHLEPESVDVTGVLHLVPESVDVTGVLHLVPESVDVTGTGVLLQRFPALRHCIHTRKRLLPPRHQARELHDRNCHGRSRHTVRHRVHDVRIVRCKNDARAGLLCPRHARSARSEGDSCRT